VESRQLKQLSVKTACYLVVLYLSFFAFNIHAGSSVIKILTKNPQQGSMILGQLLVDGDVYFNDQKLLLTKDKKFVFGVDRDVKQQVQLLIHSNNKTVKYPLNIAKRQWKVEKVDGLPPNKVNPRSEKTLTRIKKEGAKVSLARSKKTDALDFLSRFIMPAKGRISGVFGSQRVLNGQPKRPHFGLDIANKIGTSVIAPAAGKIILAEKNLFYSGGTIIIDHGFGINTTYLHLSQLDVKVGQLINQAEKIGEIGSTGRATGPHLDWRLNWLTTRLDPALLIEQ
jgi:murein DD-endopeptidase MepM/ murein hydrolase activator NlpD